MSDHDRLCKELTLHHQSLRSTAKLILPSPVRAANTPITLAEVQQLFTQLNDNSNKSVIFHLVTAEALATFLLFIQWVEDIEFSACHYVYVQIIGDCLKIYYDTSYLTFNHIGKRLRAECVAFGKSDLILSQIYLDCKNNASKQSYIYRTTPDIVKYCVNTWRCTQNDTYNVTVDNDQMSVFCVMVDHYVNHRTGIVKTTDEVT
jgi:hypothetical protein